MTPASLITTARSRYNAVSDNFYTDAELLSLIWQAEKELAIECLCIESTGSASTTASKRDYDVPTDAISLFRIEYNGVKLKPFTFRDDDLVTLNNSATTATGTPAYYCQWGEKYYLRPVPVGVGTLTLYFYKTPDVVESADATMEVPEPFHLSLLYYLVREMAIKDSNPPIATYYSNMWDREVLRCKKWMHRRRRGDQPAMVQDVDSLPNTLLGWA